MSDHSSAKSDEPTGERPSSPRDHVDATRNSSDTQGDRLDATRDSSPSQGDRFNVTWESPVFDLSGYAASSRSALFGLEALGVRLRLIPFPEKIEKQP